MRVSRYQIATFLDDIVVFGWLFCHIVTISGTRCLLRSYAFLEVGFSFSEVLEQVNPLDQ